MRDFLIRTGALLLVALLLISSASEAEAGCRRAKVAGIEAQLPNTNINQNLLSAAILAEVNYERCRNGLRALKPEPRLTKVAAGHSKWMARHETMSHRGANTLMQRLKHSGVKFRTGAENLGMVHYYQVDRRHFLTKGTCKFTTRSGKLLPTHSYGSLARAAVTNWMNSPGHRANILNRQIKLLGSAAHVNTQAEFCGKIFLTQEFSG